MAEVFGIKTITPLRSINGVLAAYIRFRLLKCVVTTPKYFYDANAPKIASAIGPFKPGRLSPFHQLTSFVLALALTINIAY